MQLFVGNLAFKITEKDLTQLFSDYGQVDSVKLINDHLSGQSRGFGFVEMSTNAQADAAIKSLNNSNFQGRIIKVNQAQKKTSKRNDPRKRYR